MLLEHWQRLTEMISLKAFWEKEGQKLGGVIRGGCQGTRTSAYNRWTNYASHRFRGRTRRDCQMAFGRTKSDPTIHVSLSSNLRSNEEDGTVLRVTNGRKGRPHMKLPRQERISTFCRGVLRLAGFARCWKSS
jgi:hypothetical protein